MKTKNADAMIKFVLSLDSNGAIKGIEELGNKSDNLTKKFSTAGKALTLGLTAPLTGLAAAGIKYNASMETYMANLTTLLNGNQEAASQLLTDLKAMANTTPFETTSLVKATQTMLGFGVQLQDSQKYLKQLGDIAMGDANKLDGLTLAFAQVQSAGKLSGQDLLQMINQGFNPLNVISQKTGESMASLKERMGEGALSAQEVAQALQWATEEGGLFYGAMDKASQTTAGKLSTLKDEFSSALGELTTSLLPIFTKVVDKLTEMARWFGNLSDEQKKTILTIAGIAVAIGPVLLVLGKVISLVSTAVKIIKVLKTAVVAVNAVLLANPIGLIIAAIAAVIAIVVLLYNKCEWFRNLVNSIFGVIISVLQTIWNTIVNVVTSIWDFLSPIFDFIKNAIILNIAIVSMVVQSIFDILVTIGQWIWDNVLSPVINFFKSAFNFIWGIISPVIEKIKNAFQTVGNFVKTVFTNIKNFIANIFNTVAGVIKAPINGVINAINSVLKSMNKIKIPDWVPGLGGKHPNFSLIPKLNVGTNYVAGDGLAYLHKGEAVVPKKYNPAVGGYGGNGINNITIVADMDVNKFGKAFVRDVKTFSGGAKNSYNYGGGQ